jgi:hypothetical protein
MHILGLAAAAIATTSAPAPVEHQVTVFQQEFPLSHQNGKREYERFVARDLFDASGRPRTVGLIGCSRTCEYMELRTAGDTSMEWSVGEKTPIAMEGEDGSKSGVVYLLKGQKGTISYAGGKGSVQIEDHHLDQGAAAGGASAYSVLAKTFSTRRDNWSYYRTYSKDGTPVMRLLVIWENLPRTAAN